MPPKNIEVWAGETAGTVKLLKTLSPLQPVKKKGAYFTGYDFILNTQPVKCIKLVVKPLPVLPKRQQRKKGDKGWAFVDEVFLN